MALAGEPNSANAVRLRRANRGRRPGDPNFNWSELCRLRRDRGLGRLWQGLENRLEEFARAMHTSVDVRAVKLFAPRHVQIREAEQDGRQFAVFVQVGVVVSISPIGEERGERCPGPRQIAVAARFARGIRRERTAQETFGGGLRIRVRGANEVAGRESGVAAAHRQQEEVHVRDETHHSVVQVPEGPS